MVSSLFLKEGATRWQFVERGWGIGMGRKVVVNYQNQYIAQFP